MRTLRVMAPNLQLPPMNIVELIADEQHAAPCRYGNIVDGHACYCHHPAEDAPRKCPIWRNYGEHDLEHWRVDMDWEDGCPYFEVNAQSVPPERSAKDA